MTTKDRVVSVLYGIGGAFLLATLWFGYVIYQQHAAMWNFMTQPRPAASPAVSQETQKKIENIVTPPPTTTPGN